MKIKNIQILFLFLIFALSYCCGNKNEANSNKSSDEKYVAYYFHPTARCESCKNLESYIKELIETKYTGQGFEFQAFNTDESENEHYKNDYELKYSSVILVKFGEGKQLNWLNLDSVWSFTDNKQKFFEYSEKEINKFIKE